MTNVNNPLHVPEVNIQAKPAYREKFQQWFRYYQGSLLGDVAPFALTGLTPNADLEAMMLKHFPDHDGLHYSRTYTIDIADEHAAVQEVENGLRLPSSIFNNPNNFSVEVMFRILEFVGIDDYNQEVGQQSSERRDYHGK